MGSWEKQKPALVNGQVELLPMDSLISVGFGNAELTKDGALVWREGYYNTAIMCVGDAENLALKDPEHDWRIHFVAPLFEKRYQRQGEGAWVLYFDGEGFA